MTHILSDKKCKYIKNSVMIGYIINFLENIQPNYYHKKKIFDDKTATKIWLKNNNLPYVKKINYNNIDNIDDNIDDNNKIIVIKPINDTRGNGIYIDKRINLPRKLPINYMAEEFITGKHYRIVVYKGNIISVVLRTPAHVIGDGINTINELINIENKNRCDNTKLYCDTRCKNNLNTILDKNIIYYINPVSNYAKGGTIQNVNLKQINKDVIEMCNKIYKLLNINLFGIDFICKNIEDKLNYQNCAINELEIYNDIDIHIILNDDTYKLYKNLLKKWILIIIFIILCIFMFYKKIV
jgi:cyanophycin synthetase